MGLGSGAVCRWIWGDRGVIGNFLLWAWDLVQCVGGFGVIEG